MNGCVSVRRWFLTIGFAIAVAPALAQTAAPATCNRTTANRPPPTAQMIAARQAVRQACAADVAAFCQGVSAACGMRQQCLAAHSAQLSPACQSARQSLLAARLTMPR